MAMSELLVAAVCVALVFYWLRCRRRLVYGLVELGVGLAVIFLTLYPQAPNYLSDTQVPPLWGWLPSYGVGITLGIYVMVSELDNIGKSLPPKWRSKWEHIFNGRAGRERVAAESEASSKGSSAVRKGEGGRLIGFFQNESRPACLVRLAQ